MATISGMLSFIGIAAVALVVVWALGLQRLNAPGPLQADKVVNVQRSEDASVVDQLAAAGVIDSRVLMTATLWLEGERSNVKSGEYMFKQGASLRDVIDLMISGKQVLHAVTVPEGLTSGQTVERLRDNDVLVGDVATVPAEGTLMPDTYKFARGTTREQVIRSMQAEEKKVLAEVWSNRSPDTPIRSPFELVTLASIVEKETGRADERPHVASVFVNRLARNMPLQSDPTIVYGLVGGKGTLGRGILKSELEQKTPYNTYQIQGLPPGPIANPGKAALEAVANPSRTRDLYFVADGTGGHAFADSLAQHQANVQRWRQIERDAKDKLSPDAAPSVTPPAKINQRSGASDDAQPFGALDLNISGSAPRHAVSVTSFPIGGFGLATGVAGFAPVVPAPQGRAASGGQTFDELDVEVAGLRSRSDPDEAIWAGSAATPDNAGGSMQSFPVSPQLLAEQRSRALAYGLQPTSNVPAMSDPAAPQRLGAVSPGGVKLYGKGRIVDASEGTSFDPLKDHSYDLTSAKVVPVLRALPPVQPIASSN